MRCPYLLVLLLPGVAYGTCLVEVKDCDFPFTVDGKQHDRCLADGDSTEIEASGEGELKGDESPGSVKGVEEYNPVNVEHYCHVQMGKSYVQGVCNSGCFDPTSGMPFSFAEGSHNLAMFCRTESSACQFPFIWEDKTYTSCTKEGSDFYWCAVSVHQNRTLREKRWGKCDMKTCEGDENADGLSGEKPKDNRIMIIIIVLIVVIVFLIVIITALICYCLRRNKRKSLEIKGSDSSLDDDIMKMKKEKHPLYDELSIPFIDASCPPTPKLEGSYVFTRTGSLRRASRSSSTDESSDK